MRRLLYLYRGVLIIWGVLLLSGGVWGLLVAPWRAALRQLPALRQARGTVQEAAIRLRRGKNAYYYLDIKMLGQQQHFGIRNYQSKQPLSALVAQLPRGQAVLVYYDSKSFWLSEQDVNFNVCQVEAADRVIYSWAEVRQRHLRDGAWGLVISCLAGVLLFFFFRPRAPA